MLYIIRGVGGRSNLILRVVFELFVMAHMCNVLYGHYYVFNYIQYDQKTANEEHECEYITQLGQRKIID